ncbi:phosphate/phosphite/phosphonate ABC transporter substrate-binding protein [Thiovibrio frasassiensis]|uniref:Phosphate/phosphite/phosphonate ABC transporter substrate-binding protein n=1 Tax=Thiovibrio frasassiensis TaxID=2984131 RepID=A0A9X4MIL1_9BACT|nr:phosphate/phosphite/phosphonate ABC transporter substrate-binding protein [Thiovibrio frasassiensis]MDG4475549.1 phosphate/phosphite/phosphonate ABC transporter substrate-binding protein [Thiovibrio frasassiensis]
MQKYLVAILLRFPPLLSAQGLRRILTLLLLLLSLSQTGEAADKPRPIQIAITPCTDILKTFKEYQPLAAYLQRQLRQPVKLIIPKDFPEFERLITAGGAEFAFQAPHTYVRLSHLYNRKMLLKALTPEGESRHRGVIIVRKDSPLQRIEDLKGKYVIFGAENDMAKNLSAKRLLTAKGINPDTNLRGYKHDGSCESIALNVFLKTADAGAICDYSFKNINASKEGTETELPPNQLRILGETEEIPTWVFAARAEVDPKLIARLNEALTALTLKNNNHEEILESAEIGGFVKAQDQDFAEIRKIMSMAR